MRVLHLTRLFHPHIGGVENHLQEINKFFLTKKIDVSILTTKHESTLAESEVIDGVSVFRLDVFEITDKNGFFLKLKMKLCIWKQVFQKINLFLQADIVHIHDVSWWILPIYPLIWQKTYITFHGYEGDDIPTYGQVFWHRLGANLTRANICIGGFHQKWYGVKSNVISFGAVSKIKKIKIKKEKKVKKIIYLGRLSYDNGIIKYLEAVKICHDSGQKVIFDVYGDGPLMEKARNFAERHSLEVNFFGFDHNARNIIVNYDFAFVSRYLAILEALVSAVPVISQYNNNLEKDYLELSPFKDWIKILDNAEKIAKAIMENDFSNQDILLAQKWSEQQTWEAMANNYLKIWEKK